jgi:hypothetical protein
MTQQGQAMTGDALITALVQAPDQAAADAIAATAPAFAVSEAADTMYLTDEPHGLAWYRRAVAREARC